MTTLPAAQPTYAVNPLTGEAVELATATTDVLAAHRDAIRDARDALNAWAAQLDTELTARLDHEAKRSAMVGGYVIKATAPTVRETDEMALRAALEELRDEGVISAAAVDNAVEIIMVPKARRAGINALHKHADERVREVVAAHDREVENPTRRVTVSRAA